MHSAFSLLRCRPEQRDPSEAKERYSKDRYSLEVRVKKAPAFTGAWNLK